MTAARVSDLGRVVEPEIPPTEQIRPLPCSPLNLTHEIAVSFERMLRIVEDMNIRLVWRDMGPKRRGEYIDANWEWHYPEYGPSEGRSLIVANPRLTVTQAVNVLAHEIAHAMFGDTESNYFTEQRAVHVASVLAADPIGFRARRLERGHIRGNTSFGLTEKHMAALCGPLRDLQIAEHEALVESEAAQ